MTTTCDVMYTIKFIFHITAVLSTFFFKFHDFSIIFQINDYFKFTRSWFIFGIFSIRKGWKAWYLNFCNEWCPLKTNGIESGNRVIAKTFHLVPVIELKDWKKAYEYLKVNFLSKPKIGRRSHAAKALFIVQFILGAQYLF